MRLVAVSRVRNEADIVEAFIRHTAALVDLHLVIDNASTDATPEILGSLQEEGIPLSVSSESMPGFRQTQQTIQLMQEATRQGASWVIPLDCDEFLDCAGRDGLEAALGDDTRPALVKWRTFVPDPGDDLFQRNPVIRLGHHLRVEAEPWTKVMVPASLASRSIPQPGNHDVGFGGGDPGRTKLDGSVVLAHFPVRSVEQYAVKVAIGDLQQSARSADRRGLGFHYEEPFRLLTEDWPAFVAGYYDAAHRYAVPAGLPFQPEVVLDPITYRGAPLRYTPPQRDSEPWRSILEYACFLARHIGVENDRAAESHNRFVAVEDRSR